jgi:hypothetical protein
MICFLRDSAAVSSSSAARFGVRKTFPKTDLSDGKETKLAKMSDGEGTPRGRRRGYPIDDVELAGDMTLCIQRIGNPLDTQNHRALTTISNHIRQFERSVLMIEVCVI